ncbi:hypothetical protein C8R43DRAFT_1118489 [Mycena crocata]|nr:hypothetical protein C8R43DRAFT_1118489 [Mycena crocata]
MFARADQQKVVLGLIGILEDSPPATYPRTEYITAASLPGYFFTARPVTAELRPSDESDDEKLSGIGDILNRAKQEKTQAARMRVDGEDDGNWSETRGTSPHVEDNNASGEEDITLVDDDNAGGEGDITLVNDEGPDDDDNEVENQAPGQIKAHCLRRVLTVIDSGSEKEENEPPVKRSASFILRERLLDHYENQSGSPIEALGATLHPGSACSADERREDEGGTENDTHFMYNRSDDTHNKPVPRHPVITWPEPGRQGSSLFGLLDRMQRDLSMPPGDRRPVGDGSDEERENGAGGRRHRPRQTLPSDADPFSAEVGPSTIVCLRARLKQASPSPEPSTAASKSTLPQPSFEAPVHVGTKTLGFSQRSSEDAVAGFKGASLQHGFSYLFETGTEEQRPAKRPLGMSPPLSEKSQTGLFGLRQNTVSLGLTQDLDLQPAFEVGGHLKRQADDIFEKEQQYLWEAANRLEAKRQELFLTQTRPDVEEPEIYRPSSPTQQEAPEKKLEAKKQELFLTQTRPDVEEPEIYQPSSRESQFLEPGSAFQGRYSPSPTRARCPTIAFESEFVTKKAHNSHDEMLGFDHNGDEEDGEDALETLVDDKEMDATALSEARVREKYQEHAHGYDLANERLHHPAVQGKKRRNRVDDSDEEDEEEENRQRKMRRGHYLCKDKGAWVLLQDALHRSAQTALSMILELDGEFDARTDYPGRQALHLLLQHSRRRRTASSTCDFRQLPLISPPSGNFGMLNTIDIMCDDEEEGTLGLEGAIFAPLPGLRQLTLFATKGSILAASQLPF